MSIFCASFLPKMAKMILVFQNYEVERKDLNSLTQILDQVQG